MPSNLPLQSPRTNLEFQLAHSFAENVGPRSTWRHAGIRENRMLWEYRINICPRWAKVLITFQLPGPTQIFTIWRCMQEVGTVPDSRHCTPHLWQRPPLGTCIACHFCAIGHSLRSLARAMEGSLSLWSVTVRQSASRRSDCFSAVPVEGEYR